MLMSLFGTVAPALRLPPLWAAGEQGILIDPSTAGTLYQDDAGTTPVTSAGQSVGRVLDLSGRGAHLPQATAAKRPTFQTDSSGRPYLAFDGVDDRLSSSALAWGTSTVTVVVAMRREGGGGARQIAGFGNTSSDAGSWGLLAQPVTGDPIAYGLRRRGVTGVQNFDSSNNWPATETAVITMVQSMSAPLARLQRNGVLDAETTASGGTGTFGTWSIDVGARPNDTTPFAGRIYGLLAINRLLTTQELALAERWMARKCGVTL